MCENNIGCEDVVSDMRGRLEIKMPVINTSPDEIKTWQLCYIEKKVLHVFAFGKLRKWYWFYRLFLKYPIKVGMIKGVDGQRY